MEFLYQIFIKHRSIQHIVLRGDCGKPMLWISLSPKSEVSAFQHFFWSHVICHRYSIKEKKKGLLSHVETKKNTMLVEDFNSDDDCVHMEAQSRSVTAPAVSVSAAAPVNPPAASTTTTANSRSNHTSHHRAITSLPAMEVAVHNESIFSTAISHAAAMVEPLEFYSVRTKAKPKAPSVCRLLTAFALLFTGIALFITVLVQSLYAYSVETDIFQIKELHKDQWDSCVPTTTLGSNWAPSTLTFLDDCNSFLKFKLSNVWYPDVDTCIAQLNATSHTTPFCQLAGEETIPHVNGTMCRNNMPFYPSGEGFVSYSCNGIPITNCTLAKASNCDGNFVKLEFDYSMKWMKAPPGPQLHDCHSNIVPLCQAIFASGNPYKCTRKKYTTVLASIANAYSFSTLIFSLAVAFFSISFSIVFSRMELKEIDLADDNRLVFEDKKVVIGGTHAGEHK